MRARAADKQGQRNHVATADQADTPIYDILIAERGDLPADAQRTAEQTRRTAARVLNWNSPAPDRPPVGTVAPDTGRAGPEPEHAPYPQAEHDRSRQPSHSPPRPKLDVGAL